MKLADKKKTQQTAVACKRAGIDVFSFTVTESESYFTTQWISTFDKTEEEIREVINDVFTTAVKNKYERNT